MNGRLLLAHRPDAGSPRTTNAVVLVGIRPSSIGFHPSTPRDSNIGTDDDRWSSPFPAVINRTNILPIAIVAALALTACGGDDDGSSAPSTDPPSADPPSADVAPDTASEAPAETAAVDPAESGDTADDSAGTEDGCDQVLSPAEIESILGVAPEIKGSGEVCQLIYASDAVGTFQAFSGSKGDEAIDTLLSDFQTDEYKSANGVPLDDGRGYVLDSTAVVRGDSGRVFVFGAPDSLDLADTEAAMQGIADLLLTR